MSQYQTTTKIFKLLLLVLVAIIFTFFVNGCKKRLIQTLDNKYQATVSIYKHFNFNQPSQNKSKHDITGTDTTLLYSYESEKSTQDTHFRILIYDFSAAVQNKSIVEFGDNKDSSFVKQKRIEDIIEHDYKIKISDNGDINIINPELLLRNISQDGIAEIVSKIFKSKQTIDLYHHILIYDSQRLKSLKEGMHWEEFMEPEGLLAPRRYKKEYVVKNIDLNEIATIDIMGTSDEEFNNNQELNSFVKMFEVRETYYGQMKVDIKSTKVLNYQEELTVVYSAIEVPDGESRPDKLEIIFKIDQNICLVE